MGAFHTTLTFLAVIGKRFSESGLRDWIIEADILGKTFNFSKKVKKLEGQYHIAFNIFFLGKGSVDRVIAGKHYSYCIRTYQYLYDAISRMRIDHFSRWLQGDSQDSLHHFIESAEFASCMENVGLFYILINTPLSRCQFQYVLIDK